MTAEITVKTVDGVDVFSCGCKAQVIGGNYVMEPCGAECRVFKYFIEESVARGNHISVVDTRGDHR